VEEVENACPTAKPTIKIEYKKREETTLKKNQIRIFFKYVDMRRVVKKCLSMMKNQINLASRFSSVEKEFDSVS